MIPVYHALIDERQNTYREIGHDGQCGCLANPPLSQRARNAPSGEYREQGNSLQQVANFERGEKIQEKENARLKKVVANLSLDKDILNEALRGNY